MSNIKYKPVIGLEVHVELNTKSKMFCSCSAQYFGEKPNTHTCPVCLGLPGALPVPNEKAIEWCVMIGMALNCNIPLFAKFDRKNYFYPDLAKGYQISQYDEPFCRNGFIHLAGTASQHLRGDRLKQSGNHGSSEVDTRKTIRIRRVHMEEDTAKLMHQFGVQSSKFKVQNDEGYSLIDFNRSGVPLVEIVTEPDFENAQEVKEYLQKLQQIIRYLEVSTADMEKGQMRMEPNISLREMNTTNTTNKQILPISNDQLPKYKVEVKNINSFRFVEKAVNFEIERQQKILESGQIPAQETRGWDEKKQITYSQRTKEEAMEYRYFPEPDIPPLRLTKQQISDIKNQIGELPEEKLEKFVKQYKLSSYNAEILTREKELADYFEEATHVVNEISNIKYQISNKGIADWIINKKINIQEVLPAQLISQILSSIQTDQIDEKELEKIINEVLSENAKAVEDYKKGKENVIMYLIGQVMRKIGKKIDTRIVKENMEAKIK